MQALGGSRVLPSRADHTKFMGTANIRDLAYKSRTVWYWMTTVGLLLLPHGSRQRTLERKVPASKTAIV